MNMMLGELFSLVDIDIPEKFHDLEFPRHLATDSRDVINGGAFVALEGERTDGHKFIHNAIENGASLIFVRKNKVPENIPVPVIELEDPERDLARAASAKLDNHNLSEIIAITGSVGKTSTRAALENILSKKFVVHAPERSFNTLIGCTATILAMPLETEILILEFGANKPGEIRELTKYFAPTISIITAIAPVHLEGFKTVEGVLHEKLEITRSRKIRRIFFNNDNEILSDRFKYIVKSFGVGLGKDSDYVIDFDRSDYSLPSLSFVLASRVVQEIAHFSVNVWGKHNAMPLCLASAVADSLGISLDECSEALRDFQALPGRGRVIFLDDDKFLVDDAYNANPASMRASLETFANVKIAGKIAVLGEMRELGENSAMYHSELNSLLDDIDHVILVGDVWREAMNDNSRYVYADDWKNALVHVHEIMSSQEWRGILVKGSNSIGLSNIVKDLTA